MASKNDGIRDLEGDKSVVQQSTSNTRTDQFRLREMEQQKAFQKEKEQLDSKTKFMDKFKHEFKNVRIPQNEYDDMVSRANAGILCMEAPEPYKPIGFKPSPLTAK